ncbi:hypothetical protein ABK040_003437 [Willaertia magna]
MNPNAPINQYNDNNPIGQKFKCFGFINTCPQGCKVIKYFGGKMSKISDSGFYKSFPFLTEARLVYTGISSATVMPNNIVTLDGCPLGVTASIQYLVVDPDKAAHNLCNLYDELKDNLIAAIRQTFLTYEVEQVFEHQRDLSILIRKELNRQYAARYESKLEKNKTTINKENTLVNGGNNNNLVYAVNSSSPEELTISDKPTTAVLIENEMKSKKSDKEIDAHAKMWLEHYFGIEINIINLETIQFPQDFMNSKLAKQQNMYQQRKIEVENQTNVLVQESKKKLIEIEALSTSTKLKTEAEAKKQCAVIENETLEMQEKAAAIRKQIAVEAEKNRMEILANAKAREMEIMEKAIKENPNAHKFKLLLESSDAWGKVQNNSKLIMYGGTDQTNQPFNFMSQSAILSEVLKN